MLKYLKIFYRLFKYQAEWHKQYREIGIRHFQNDLIKKKFSPIENSLVLFITLGSDYKTGIDQISGGIISIISLCEETEKLKSTTIAATLKEEHLLKKYTQFENNTPIFRFEQLPNYFKELEKLIIHLPELIVKDFFIRLNEKDLIWINKIKFLHINILNQSIHLMPSIELINEIKSKVNHLTITTAHQQYCNKVYKELYGAPLHKLSTWISPENYYYKNWKDKENIIIISPDEYPPKDFFIKKLQSNLPTYQIIVINNLTYNEYKKLISRAKFSITFGEGLDGYFIEPVFSGAISFAVYNETFFTDDYKHLSTIYDSYVSLEEHIITKIKEFDNEQSFALVNKELFDVCAKHYSFATYQNNIKLFYEKKYTFQ